MSSPFYLWALFFCGLPFLIKWIKTGKPQEVVFSQMYLLQKALRQHREMQRKNPLLLLIVRILQVACLVFIVVGFILPSSTLSSSKSYLIVLDDTIYMQARRDGQTMIWKQAKNEVLNYIDRLNEESEVALITYSGIDIDWLVPSEMKQKVESLQVSYLESSWITVRRKLKQLMRKRKFESLQATLFGVGKVSDQDAFKKVISLLPEGGLQQHIIEDSNLKNSQLDCKTFATKNGILFKLKIVSLQKECEVEITNSKGDVIRKIVQSNQENEIVIKDKSYQTGKIEIKVNDKFGFDNIHYFSVKESELLNVGYFSFKGSSKRLKDPDYYLRKGFESIESQFNIKTDFKDPSDWKNFKFKSDILFLHDLPFISDTIWKKLTQYVNQGGVLFIIVGPNTPVELYDHERNQLMPASLKVPIKGTFGLKLSENWKRDCPRFSKSEMRGRWSFFRLKDKSKVLYTFNDGAPFWIKNMYGKGTVHLLSSPFHMLWSHTVLYYDYSQVLFNCLKELSPSWISDPNQFTLVTGKSFPKSFSSFKSIFNSKFDHQNLEPGLYDCRLKNGKEMILTCNDFTVLIKRSWVEINQKKGEGNFSLNASSFQRNDYVALIVFLILLVIESIIFIQNFNPKLKHSL